MRRMLQYFLPYHGILVVFLVCEIGLFAQPSGNSLVFNGSTDYVNVPHHSNMNPSSSITAEAWIFPCKVSGSNFILGKWWCGGFEQNAYYFVVYDGKLRWGWDLDGCGNGARIYESAAAIIQPNQWHHIAAVHTPTSVALYLNGLPVPGQLIQGSYSAMLQNQEPFRLGVYRDITNAYWGNFMGRMDEVRVWNYNLSPAEIYARYNVPLVGSETGLVAYYNMDGTGSGNNLPVINSAQLTGSTINGSSVGTTSSPYYLSNALDLLPVDLGNDTVLCTGDVLLLNASQPLVTYQWQDGSPNPFYQVIFQGVYWVEISLGLCSNSDTIQVDYQPAPVIDLGDDTIICEGNALVINAFTPGASYRWQDGSTLPHYAPSQSGLYWVEVSIGSCSASDTIMVSIIPAPHVNLGNDTSICEGETLVLDVSNSGATYLWQDGADYPVYTVTQSGMYWVQVNNNDCSASDTIMVAVIPFPFISLGNDTTICEGTSINLQLEASYISYLWNTGVTLPSIVVADPGLYWVEVGSDCGPVRDSIQVLTENCDCGIWIPSAFSPNKDGINDYFEVKGNCISEYHIMIFTRWGELIYESFDLAKPWDGSYKGQVCPVSVYAFRIEYKMEYAEEEETEVGGVVVMR